MRVLHIYRTYFPDPPGGLQEAMRQICVATSARGVKNTILTLSPRPEPAVRECPEARVIRARSWATVASCDLGGLSAWRRYATLSREAGAIFHHFPWPFGDLLYHAARPETPAAMLYHSDIVRQRWLARAYVPLMWQTLRAMRVIVATSPAYARTSPVLSDPSIRHKVRVIPLGIEESSYPKAGDGRVFARIGLSSDAPFFLFVGVLRYYKGLDFLIRAAREVEASVVIAGSGPEKDRILRLRDEIGADNVNFAGQISDEEKVALLERCRALVLPSHLRSEAYGMVLVEAAMFGRPLISCEIGTGTSFVNEHGISGLVVPPENPAALANAMNTLLRDEALVRHLGQGARARYERLFSGPALGKAYADLFQEMASGGPAVR